MDDTLEKESGLHAASTLWNDDVRMRDLNDLYYLVQVVQHGGFAAAGRALNLPKSTLSRRVKELEARLGASLIHRSSRRFAVTDIGRDFLRHAQAMLIEADAADSSVQTHLVEPSGTVRFTCPLGMSSMLAKAMPRFLEAHPKVCLVQHATNRFVDIVEEGYDLALRGHFGTLTDSSLIHRRLIHTPWTLVASPTYLEQAGEPLAPGDLARHPAVMLGSGGAEGTWVLRSEEDNEPKEVSVNVRMRSDDMGTLKTLAAAGIGITALPSYLSRPEVDSRLLKRVLPQWTTGEGIVTLLMVSRRGQLPSVRAFVEFLVDEFGKASYPASATSSDSLGNL